MPTRRKKTTQTIPMEITITRNTKRPRITRENEPSGETINNASKTKISPLKKKSKAGEGKDENEIKFPIGIIGENLSTGINKDRHEMESRHVERICT